MITAVGHTLVVAALAKLAAVCIASTPIGKCRWRTAGNGGSHSPSVKMLFRYAAYKLFEAGAADADPARRQAVYLQP